MQSSLDGSVKIGWSTNPVTRSRLVRPSREADLTIIRLVDAPRWVERWFHWKFAECRLVGEWFTFRPDMLSLDPPKERPAFVIPRRGDGRTRLVAVRLSDIEMDLLRSIAGRESRVALSGKDGCYRHAARVGRVSA